jgi:hypothetical protein
MNKLIVAHIRPPSAYEITRAIENDKKKEENEEAEAFAVVLWF